MKRLTTTIALGIVALAAAPGAARASETIKLDLRSPANATVSDAAAQTVQRLASGGDYVLTISGTGSIWDTADYGGNVCGKPEATPIEPSPGAPPVIASWDAAMVFAAPNGAPIRPGGNACKEVQLPTPSGAGTYSGFEFSTAGTGAYVRGIPYGGVPTVPSAGHVYSYELKGTGVPLRVRFDDRPADDNSGVFTIVVRTRAECDAVNCLGLPAATVPQSGTGTPGAATPGITGATTTTGTADTGAVKGVRYCNLDRVLSVRIQQPKGKRFTKVAYYLNGRYQRTVSGSKIRISRFLTLLRAQKFRTLPSGPLSLRVVATTSTGKKLTSKQTVQRCMPRIKARAVKFV